MAIICAAPKYLLGRLGSTNLALGLASMWHSMPTLKCPRCGTAKRPATVAVLSEVNPLFKGCAVLRINGRRNPPCPRLPPLRGGQLQSTISRPVLVNDRFHFRLAEGERNELFLARGLFVVRSLVDAMTEAKTDWS
jgi:hypothetical protein